MADALDELDAAARKSYALRRIVAVTRRHPDIWDRGPGAYSSYPKVIRMWRAIEASLEDIKPHRRDKFAVWLISTAREFIEEEDARLAVTWRHITSSGDWAKLPRSARCLYEALHAVAAEQGGLGGPRVQMCHTLAIELIHARTGLRRYSKGTVTNARVVLVKAGFIEAEVGAPWIKGVKSRATVYDLLPENIRDLQTELSQAAAGGIVQFCRPGLSGSERELVMCTIAALAEERRQQEERERRKRNPGPAPDSAIVAAETDAGLDELLDPGTRRCDDDEEPGAGSG